MLCVGSVDGGRDVGGRVVVKRVVVGVVLAVVELTVPVPVFISFKLLSTASAMTRLASAASGSSVLVFVFSTDF